MRRIISKTVLQCVVLDVVLIFLNGCVYIPFPERVNDTGNAGDFRGVFGPSGSAKPLQVGWSKREDVLRRLGEPELLSADGNSFGYTLGTVSGLRIFLPLFFFPVDAVAHAYGLRVEFGHGGYVRRFEISRIDRDINEHLIGYTGLYRFNVLEQMNRSEPRLYGPSELSLHIVPATLPTP